MKTAAQAYEQFDRLMSGTVGAFPFVADQEKLLALVQDAGRAGVTLYWAKAVWAFRADYATITANAAALQDFYAKHPWAAAKHKNWQLKYRNGWEYRFETDTWTAPA